MKDWPWYGHVLLMAIIAGLLYFVWFKPKNEELNNLRLEREKVEADVRLLRQKKKELDKIEAEIIVLNQTLKRLEAIIPQRKEIWDILKKTNQLALDSRLNIVNFQPQGEVNKEFYFEWPIDFEITGNYHNLALFFDRLSTFSRLFNVENFSIKSLSRQTDSATISAKYTAKTYIFRDISPEEMAEKKKPKRGR